MSVDLTCPECEGSGQIRLGTEELGDDLACLRCEGAGRCRPTFHEWDRLVAERDRLRRVIQRYGQHDADCAVEVTEGTQPCDCGFEACLYPAVGAVPWSDEARAALDGDS